nr:vitamin B12 dependent-methionine synthase activation domain-containing protein [Feifania hominis]
MVQSRGLIRHLAGCDEIILFAATLGAGVDRLIQRASVADMGRAVVLQACAASMIESYCDERQAQLLENYLVQGRHFKPRFSPGYADFSLTYQRDILQLLDAPKRMGLTATESCMLAPTKSVTAIIGVTQGKAEAAADKCESCPAVDCPYRKGNDR